MQRKPLTGGSANSLPRGQGPRSSNERGPTFGAVGALMKSAVVKRSVVIGGHYTSVSLEDVVWRDLKNIAHSRQETLSELVEEIDRTRDNSNLSSAIRLFVLEHFRSKRQVHRSDAPVLNR